ncbi:minor tail protein [Streptomyces phage Ibantik]|uniref:Minor tail protein n=1 Tax=Streptomyces phage Ibantik TaxID=2182397 RepID=A0A2U8UNW4_9CAUD|nr:minor tail protein [Streptomyces phage Ibantik]AWN05303.1 minor tail protein [Streptomyces phage Ibantik]
MGYRIEVRDKELNRIGEIDTWIQLDMVIQHCDQGSWKLLVKAGTPQADLLQQGGGVAVYQDDVPTPILTGQIEDFQKYFTTVQHSSEGSIFVGGKTDNKLAYSRLAFVDPAKTVAQQYSTILDVRMVKAPASRLIWDEVQKSLGSGALVDRRAYGVNTGTAPAFGPSKSDSLRYDVIGEKFAEWCSDKKTGWRFLWNPNTKTIDLDVYAPRDLSKSIRFSPELGNLREYIWTLSAPKVTRAIVACQGEGVDRYIYQKIDAAAEAEWGLQIEQFIDRRDLPLMTDQTNGQPMKAKPEVTDAEFEAAKEAVVQAAEEALKEGEKSGNFQLYPIDTEQIKFGRDYFVGDLVTVDVDGTERVDMVREVSITVDDGGKAVTVSPKVGEQGSGDPLNLYSTVFEMRKKLRKLEARM